MLLDGRIQNSTFVITYVHQPLSVPGKLVNDIKYSLRVVWLAFAFDQLQKRMFCRSFEMLH